MEFFENRDCIKLGLFIGLIGGTLLTVLLFGMNAISDMQMAPPIASMALAVVAVGVLSFLTHNIPKDDIRSMPLYILSNFSGYCLVGFVTVVINPLFAAYTVVVGGSVCLGRYMKVLRMKGE